MSKEAFRLAYVRDRHLERDQCDTCEKEAGFLLPFIVEFVAEWIADYHDSTMNDSLADQWREEMS